MIDAAQELRGQMKAAYPVLVVEDNNIARKYLERKLLTAGYTVVSVCNGIEALAVFKERFFPIILSDWMMPEMSGLELCKTIRNLETSGYVFFVLLTARDSKEDIINGLEAGADDYLTKPVDHSELVARLNSGMRILELERNLKQATEEIERLSVTDPLTGCFNRGYMNKKLLQELMRGKRYQRPVSVIFCDIDHFKEVNDTYGHLAGDTVLKKFASCIFDSVRLDIDWLTRYGGEEFLIILPETTADGAYCVAERIRKNICLSDFYWQEQRIPISASFGVSTTENREGDLEMSPDTLIKLADDALYQAKKNGRNQVVISPL